MGCDRVIPTGMMSPTMRRYRAGATLWVAIIDPTGMVVDNGFLTALRTDRTRAWAAVRSR